MNIATPSFRACWFRLKLLVLPNRGPKPVATQPTTRPPAPRKHRRTTAFFELP